MEQRIVVLAQGVQKQEILKQACCPGANARK